MVRIALIGLSGYAYKDGDSELVSYPWDRLAAIKNIADFDQVIVHLPTLSDSKKLTREAFDSVFNLPNLADILWGNGRFIIIGDPRIVVFPHETNEVSTGLRAQLRAAATSFIHWTLLGIEWDDRHCSPNGLQFERYQDRDAFGRYLSATATYSYSLARFHPDMDVLGEELGLPRVKQSHPNAMLAIDGSAFAASRYGTMLAGKIEFQIRHVDPDLSILSGPSHYDVLHHCGTVVFLPESALGPDVSIRILLEDAYGIQTVTQAPEWAQNTIAPNQQRIDDELTALEVEAKALHERWQALQQQRQSIREVLLLLYGEQKDLEAAVRDVLRELGADVEEPVEPNKRDGWITVTVEGEVKHAVLEVKSKRKGEFDEQGLRQLDEWQSDGISEKGIVAKRVFVGNSTPSLPPDDREWPFGSNFGKQARLREAAAIRAQDLYKIYERVQNGTIDPASFWTNLFSKNGALTLEDLVA